MKKVLGIYSNPDQHWVGDGVTLRDRPASSIVMQLSPARETDMRDKPTKDMEPAPGWRFLRFLGFGHAIGSHLLPERNCVRTQRTAPYYHDCARSGPFKAGHSSR